MIIVVASTNQIKIDAVREACRELQLGIPVEGIDVSSGVPVQPIGLKEIHAGASHRAREAHKRKPHATVIGIENGIEYVSPHWRDMSAVHVLLPDGHTLNAVSEAIAVPMPIVKKMLQRGREHTTIGKIVAELYLCNPRDPHYFLTDGKTSRQRIIKNTVQSALSQIFDTSIPQPKVANSV